MLVVKLCGREGGRGTSVSVGWYSYSYSESEVECESISMIMRAILKLEWDRMECGTVFKLGLSGGEFRSDPEITLCPGSDSGNTPMKSVLTYTLLEDISTLIIIFK